MHQSVLGRGDPTRKPGPPKLRSSCDPCGASKVKCDKGQPECGRCISHGLPCAYGVSRKMGKPPRRPSISRTLSNPVAHLSSSSHSTTTSTSSSIGEMTMELEPPALTSFLGHAWDPMDEDSSSNSILSFLNTEGFGHDLQVPAMPFNPEFIVGLSDGTPTDPPNIDMISSQLRSAASSPPMGSYSSVEAYLFPREGALDPGSGSISSRGATDHECLPKLHEILESLSVLQSRQADNKALPFAAGSENLTQPVPLDLILHLNRKATKGLASLATCSCVRLPHVAFLYASIISQILAWYRQAAGCSRNMTPPDTASASTRAAPTGTSTLVDGIYSTSALTPRSTNVTVAPSRIAIGAFSVDDQHIQTAMKIHLLSGEMKRVKDLINQLRSQADNSNATTTGVDDVIHSVNTWLEWDYARILEMMQTKLKELNI